MIHSTNSHVTPTLAAKQLAGTFPGELGIEPLQVTDERVVARLTADERHLHPGGYVHGGVWVGLADTVAGWGAMRHLQRGYDFTTAELKINVFTSARVGDELVATGVPLHIGRRTQAWEVRVERGGRLAALFLCTQMVVPTI